MSRKEFSKLSRNTNKIIRKLRRSKFEAQNGKCAYCHFPMYYVGLESRWNFARTYKLSEKTARLKLACTADHVDSLGDDSFENIVAAHNYCNSMKQSRDAEEFYNWVQEKIKDKTYWVYRIFNGDVDMSKFEVLVVRITDVVDHPNADRLSIAYFRGFGVVTAKLADGSNRYKKDDLVVYIPQDSIVPDYLLKQGYFSYDVVSEPVSKNPLTNTEGAPAVPVLADLKQFDTSISNNVCIVDNILYKTITTGKGMLDGKNGNRTKPRKIRDFISNGIMFSVSKGYDADCDDYWIFDYIENEKGKELYVNEGDDVAEFLGVIKYEPEIPVGMNGEVCYIGTNIIPSFDIENIKKYPNILNPYEVVICSEKLHGTFFGIGYVPGLNNPDLWEGEWFCYSKGLGSRGLVFKNNETNKNNLYVKQFEKLLPKLKETVPEHAYFILGEIFGPGVQDLDYGVKTPEVRIFDIYSNGWKDWSFVKTTCELLDISTVPVLFEGKLKDYDTQLKTGNSTLAKHVREGVVIKPIVTRLTPEIGRVILKDINEKYLTRKGGTEYQ